MPSRCGPEGFTSGIILADGSTCTDFEQTRVSLQGLVAMTKRAENCPESARMREGHNMGQIHKVVQAVNFAILLVDAFSFCYG